MADIMDHLSASPCCNPELGLDEAMSAYAKLGFRKFEAFDSWAGSAFDINGDPDFYMDKGKKYGLTFSSMHLPAVGEDLDISNAVTGARFAEEIGCPVVLFKAADRKTYIEAGKAFLDATDDLAIVPVLQNHFGTPISSLADFKEVLTGLNDRRMKTCLEVGHFHSAGVLWKDGYELLGDSIRLVHIKDQVGAQSIPFGTGEVDLIGLFAHMKAAGYGGDYVVEMEVTDAENTIQYLADALAYLKANCEV